MCTHLWDLSCLTGRAVPGWDFRENTAGRRSSRVKTRERKEDEK